MTIFQKINTLLLIPALGVTTGIVAFIKPWPQTSIGAKKDSETETQAFQRTDVLQRLQPHLEKYTTNPDKYHITSQRAYIPIPHHNNHVGTALLNKPAHIEIDPLVIRNKTVSVGEVDFKNDVELTAYFHLGNELSDPKTGMIHKGIVALLMDELLCVAGFPKLPHKKGVTAKLEIEHLKDIPKDTTLVLNCKIKQAKGRKCEIEGILTKVFDPSKNRNIIRRAYGILPLDKWFGTHFSNPPPTIYAKGTCLLIEPRWFKYFTWVNIF